jgi:hypothetical protein
MAKKRRGQPPIKGFRPGKEPAHLKKQRAKAQLGSDATWAQKQAVEAVAGRSPEEVRRMVRRWSLGLALAAVILAVAGTLLYAWSVVAGVVVHVLTAVVAFLAYRLRRQGGGLAEIAESMR